MSAEAPREAAPQGEPSMLPKQQQQQMKQQQTKQQQGKQQKKQKTKQAPAVRNLESFQRMNFLAQASMLMAATPIAASNDSGIGKKRKQRQRQSTLGTTEGDLAPLARFYGENMRSIGLKSQSRLSVDLKRSFCRRCNLPLLNGVTAATTLHRGRRSHGINGNDAPGTQNQRHVRLECQRCLFVRRFQTHRAIDSAEVAPPETVGGAIAT
ncbi:Rpr2-domain-containing protein [Ramicandelaber brevisporus]|nr:Rpr2-domain-containing protein [Ramicandelaber brevisporus]